MFSIALIIYACDIAGRPCREHQQIVDLSLVTCQVVSVQIIAQWQQGNPGKYAKKWRCEYLGLEKKA